MACDDINPIPSLGEITLIFNLDKGIGSKYLQHACN